MRHEQTDTQLKTEAGGVVIRRSDLPIVMFRRFDLTGILRDQLRPALVTAHAIAEGLARAIESDERGRAANEAAALLDMFAALEAMIAALRPTLRRIEGRR